LVFKKNKKGGLVATDPEERKGEKKKMLEINSKCAKTKI
jgi:hypothetical protein